METSNINGIDVIVPPSFLGILPVSPHPQYWDFEPYPFLGLKLLLRPGSIVFDIGASYGVMTTLMAKLVDTTGRVCSFEANQDVLLKAKELIKANNLGNITLINAFVGERSGIDVPFFVAPGFDSVASTGDPHILATFPDAARSMVSMLALDDFVDNSKYFPDVCKFDIEGAEYITILGMRHCLSDHSPDLVIETHAWSIPRIGGSQEQLLELLEEIGYSIFDLRTGTMMSGGEFSARYQDKQGHALISKRLRDKAFRDMVISQAHSDLKRLHLRQHRSQQRLSYSKPIRQLVDSREFQVATTFLERMLQLEPADPEWNYLAAFCLHMQKKDPKAALKYYDLAFNYGFDEFWVRYNRGSLHAETGDNVAARHDLGRAMELQPDHPGLRQLLQQLPEFSLTTAGGSS